LESSCIFVAADEVFVSGNVTAQSVLFILVFWVTMYCWCCRLVFCIHLVPLLLQARFLSPRISTSTLNLCY